MVVDRGMEGEKERGDCLYLHPHSFIVHSLLALLAFRYLRDRFNFIMLHSLILSRPARSKSALRNMHYRVPNFSLSALA